MGWFDAQGAGKKSRPVLAVDDEFAVTLLLKGVLEAIGLPVVTANRGIDALRLAESCAPRLILLDVKMPDMDGIATLGLLKENAKTRDIPVLMVTAEQTTADIDTAFGLGAVGYVVKPILIPALIEKVRAALAEPPPG